MIHYNTMCSTIIMDKHKQRILEFIYRSICTNVEKVDVHHPDYYYICFGGNVLWREYFRHTESLSISLQRIKKAMYFLTDENTIYMKKYMIYYGCPLLSPSELTRLLRKK